MAKEIEQTQQSKEKFSESRRTILKALAGIPVLGVLGYELMAKQSFDRKNDSKLIKDLGLEGIQTPGQDSKSVKDIA